MVGVSCQAELEIIPFSVRRIAKSLRKQYGILLAKLGGVEMRTHVGEGVAQVLLGDPARINQILLNFLSNAVKFTQEGSITLDIDVSEEDDRQQTLSFSVRDTGVGIREEDQAKLFQSYSQATSHTSRQFGGTGLGLAICKVRGAVACRTLPRCLAHLRPVSGGAWASQRAVLLPCCLGARGATGVGDSHGWQCDTGQRAERWLHLRVPRAAASRWLRWRRGGGRGGRCGAASHGLVRGHHHRGAAARGPHAGEDGERTGPRSND